MPVNNVNASYGTTAASTYTAPAKTAEETAAEQTKKNEDTFVKSTTETPVTYKPDTNKVNQLKSELSGNMAAFRNMVQSLLSQQGKTFNASQGLGDLLKNITVDAETKAAAQASIAEGGEWSVQATGDRILDMAKALSGGDHAKAEALRKAVQDGFKAAEKVWGGTLPSISQETYDYVMKGFDEWANSGTTKAE